MWLLAAAIRQAMEKAQSDGFAPTAEQQTALEARYDGEGPEGSGSRLLTIAGNSADIQVRGVLTTTPNYYAMYYGGGNTTYKEVNAALALIESNKAVTEATMTFDSPGGHVNGLFDTIAAIRACSKPIKAVVTGLCASAAFAMAAQCDTITATNVAVRLGSVGIVADIRVSDSVVSVTSTEAPKKRPDVTTEEGIAMVREELDAMHEIFVEAIAEGRGKKPKEINAEYGQGATVLAGDALKRGMIDSISSTPAVTTTTATSGDKTEASNMDLQTLKATHPEVYAAAVKEGQTEERDRVSAHLTMGDASGDMKTAVAAINDGSAMTAGLQAKYMAAGMNRSDSAARQADDTDTSAGADGAAASDETVDSEAEAVAAQLEANLGLEATA